MGVSRFTVMHLKNMNFSVKEEGATADAVYKIALLLFENTVYSDIVDRPNIESSSSELF